MPLRTDVITAVDQIIRSSWNARDGRVVPTSSDVTLAGGGVRLDATMLYADLADSTQLVLEQDRRVAAKVMKCFLGSCSRIIRRCGGNIRSFDGDRVMALFIGTNKNTNAVQAALQINAAFVAVIKPKLEAAYPALREGDYTLAHATGIDTSNVLAVRGGVRDYNDLVWVGRAPNVAAKLSTLRESPYHTWITADVYERLHAGAKFHYRDGQHHHIWEERTWNGLPGLTLYRSDFAWRL